MQQMSWRWRRVVEAEPNRRCSMASQNKTVLITGASRGIGAATALAAAGAGFDVAVNYLKDEAAARQVVQAITEQGRRAVAIQGDIGRPQDIERIFQEAQDRLGLITALVNNTGITGPIGPFRQTTDETLSRVFQVNVIG